MDKYKAINLIGKTLYSCIIDYPTNQGEPIKGYLWDEKIDYIGENCVYIDKSNIMDRYKIHKYKDYGKTWFLSKQECLECLNDIADEIIDETEN